MTFEDHRIGSPLGHSGHPLISIARITGISLFFQLIQTAAVKGWKVFLLGASPDSNQGAFVTLSAQYPGLEIVGHIDGFFQDSQEVVRTINASGADIVFVAMGSPKQEFWIAEHREAIDAPFCMGVGGTFDVVSGQAKWAPSFSARPARSGCIDSSVIPGAGGGSRCCPGLPGWWLRRNCLGVGSANNESVCGGGAERMTLCLIG